jgi:multiple sugar transport system substrate-binding protein
VFDAWRELLDRECFAENHTGMSWQEGQALLYQGRGAIMLMGAFVVPNFPPETAGKIGFVQFPEIVPGVPVAEDAPTNAVLIPGRATNIETGKRFLEFMMRADVQENYNRITRTLPVNTASAVAGDPFLRQGKAMLESAAALAQYFDRDTSEELAIIAMRGFQRFMVEPDSRDAVIAEIERARRRIMGLN